jgi:BlaI family penicillinase repressor
MGTLESNLRCRFAQERLMSALDEPKVLIQDLPMPKRSQPPVMPTAGEHELLEILWRLGEGTIDDILRGSGEIPPPNYKTVQTLLRIMESKRLVTHRLQGRAFVYKAQVRRDQVNRLSIRAMLQSHFGGSPTELLLNLLDDERINAAELKELEELIRRHRKEKGSLRQAKNPET